MTDFDPRAAIDARLDQIKAEITQRLSQPGQPLTNLELAAMRLYAVASLLTVRHQPVPIGDRTVCCCAPANAEPESMHDYPCPAFRDTALALGITPPRKHTDA